MKYNQFGEVISVNGITTGQHIGVPMQDAIAEKPEDNQAYATELNTVTRLPNSEETWDEQPSPSSGGVSSWNDLTDKPFYKNGVGFEFPSDVSSKVTIQSQSLPGLGGLKIEFVKVGDAFKTHEETYGGVFKANIQGQDSTFIVDEGFVNNVDTGFALIYADDGFVPLGINATSTGTTTLPTAAVFGEDITYNINETGFYIMFAEGMGQVNSFENGYTVKRLDEIFIPTTIARTSDYYTKAEIDEMLSALRN